MQFATPRELSIAYLILRHLYDGDIIEWPVPESHPHHPVFVALEQQGYVARWDRTWPKADRYRLTEKGIAAIEAVYRPAGAESTWNELRKQHLPPSARRQHLQRQGHDPFLWSILHDPSTQWDSYDDYSGRYYLYLFEDEHPRRRRHPAAYEEPVPQDPELAHPQAMHVVDLDRAAGDVPLEAPLSDYDVS